MKRLKVTLRKSTIGRPEAQRIMVRSLGLRKTNDSRELEDNPGVRGLIAKVQHLIEVVELG